HRAAHLRALWRHRGPRAGPAVRPAPGPHLRGRLGQRGGADPPPGERRQPAVAARVAGGRGPSAPLREHRGRGPVPLCAVSRQHPGGVAATRPGRRRAAAGAGDPRARDGVGGCGGDPRRGVPAGLRDLPARDRQSREAALVPHRPGPVTAHPMPSIPERLQTALADRYRIERELGQGGMATVYLAQDLRHDRKVAIKVLRPELAAIIGAERFLREIKTIATLQHPHILGLIDSGEVHGTAYYVMPFVDGESLRDRLHREKQLPIGDAIRLATEVADALNYAHRRGVIHRDIKPENILLHDGRALVADFGIALAVSDADAGTRMTETGMSLGTPHYMSPEQA